MMGWRQEERKIPIDEFEQFIFFMRFRDMELIHLKENELDRCEKNGERKEKNA
jgi:hypothetical protein